jgi:microcin C transport system substrate-binding protein
MIAAEAAYIPGWATPWHRTAYWRYVRWPDDFNVRISENPAQAHVHWIDESLRQETRQAQQTGKTFPQQDLNFDQYRQKN